MNQMQCGKFEIVERDISDLSITPPHRLCKTQYSQTIRLSEVTFWQAIRQPKKKEGISKR